MFLSKNPKSLKLSQIFTSKIETRCRRSTHLASLPSFHFHLLRLQFLRQRRIVQIYPHLRTQKLSPSQPEEPVRPLYSRRFRTFCHILQTKPPCTVVGRLLQTNTSPKVPYPRVSSHFCRLR